ncbi:hypothetical protein PFDG_00455 [Plasmodium falciparum Dd2]|uniref:Uncharacterized protein n=1 Tax=Plasmodium falciparum (isolate Dd2) TaxID=57267 RepID=A0A0L7LWV0_PLAF4|nr:hypothetical protein PFDG_00455 [Plasmodium falciparum Dd2]
MCSVLILASTCRRRFSNVHLTPAGTVLNSNSALISRRINRRKMKNCNNNDLLKVLKMETTYNELPAHNLLMSSKNDINKLFDYINKNEELSKLMNSCGTYVYLKYLGVVIFSIKENVQISHLSEFIQYLLNKNVFGSSTFTKIRKSKDSDTYNTPFIICLVLIVRVCLSPFLNNILYCHMQNEIITFIIFKPTKKSVHCFFSFFTILL